MRLNSIGRQTAVAMGFIVIIAIGVRAFANNSVIDVIARDASRYDLVRKLCPTFVSLNVEAMSKIIESTLWVGVSKFGEVAMHSAVVRETEHHNQEIRSSGIVQWCQRQRSVLLTDPVGRNALK